MSTSTNEMLEQQPLIIPTAPVGEEGRVATIMGLAKEHLGFVPDGLKLYSLSPPLLENFFANVGYFMSGTKLSPLLTTMIRYLVSSNAQCSFCIDLNEGFLDQMGVDLERAREAKIDPALAPVDDRERVLLDIALRSINDPQHIDQADMDAAHAEGWSDREIFDAVAQAINTRGFNFLLSTFNIKHQGVLA